MNDQTAAARVSAKGADEGVNWFKELRGIAIIIAIVLGIHSFVAKPFYIPSESMLPTLMVGDRLVVSKYPYGWSYASISFHLAPKFAGRLWGKLPERGDIVILEHPVTRADYIKRVIGLPGDKIELKAGQILINDIPVRQEQQPSLIVPVDPNFPGRRPDSGAPDSQLWSFVETDASGKQVAVLPIVRETLPNGVAYDTIDMGQSINDDFGPYVVPADHLFLMGDNRDGSADSRVSTERLGLGGAVPFDAIGGRAEFITFSMDGGASWYNPLSWFTHMREGRAGESLRTESRAP